MTPGTITGTKQVNANLCLSVLLLTDVPSTYNALPRGKCERCLRVPAQLVGRT
jgi:hypothetical protein